MPPMCDLDYYSICAEISAQSVLWAEAQRDWRDIKNTVQLEEGKNHRSGSMSRSYPHAGRDTAEIFGLELHGISEGKKQSDAVREIPGTEIQVSQ